MGVREAVQSVVVAIGDVEQRNVTGLEVCDHRWQVLPASDIPVGRHAGSAALPAAHVVAVAPVSEVEGRLARHGWPGAGMAGMRSRSSRSEGTNTGKNDNQHVYWSISAPAMLRDEGEVPEQEEAGRRRTRTLLLYVTYSVAQWSEPNGWDESSVWVRPWRVAFS